MTTRTKSATADVHAVENDSPHGSFEAIISTPSLDRDGDRLTPDGWKTPLPDHIPISVNHAMTADSIIGSGRPFIDTAGNLRVRGTFASTELGQTVRSLVNDGHLRTLSVEFLEQRGAKSAGPSRRELVGASLVYLPSNRDARVLSSKAAQAAEQFAGSSPDGSTADSDSGEVPVNSLDPDQLGQFVDAVDALQSTSDDDLPEVLEAVTAQLAAICQQVAPDDDQAPPDDSGATNGANATKAAAVRARIRAMVLALDDE